MAALCIDNAKRVAALGKVKVNLFYHGIFRVVEIYCYEAADGARHLVHKSAWLAEIFVLGILCYFGYCDRVNLAVVVKIVYHSADKNFICGR